MSGQNVNDALSENELINETASTIESSIVGSLSETDVNHFAVVNDSQDYRNISELPILNQILDSNSLRKQLEDVIPLATYNNVSVSNSSNVIFGNVIKVKGVLNINVFKEKNTHDKDKTEENIETTHNNWESPQVNKSLNSSLCPIVPRKRWQAMEPLEEYTYIKEPVSIVIICHTATEISTNSGTNMEIIRNIQTFHVDSQEWDDIGYNFLIGCDGNVYEGRGWGVVGIHTYGYNARSLGIAFIGNFTRLKPTKEALKSCKDLLKRGVDEGHLTTDYKLLGHRQCIATASPGRLLFEEISQWENFSNNEINSALKM